MNRKAKGESRVLGKVLPTEFGGRPLPPTIFSNCGKLLHIIYKAIINNHLRNQSKPGKSHNVRHKHLGQMTSAVGQCSQRRPSVLLGGTGRTMKPSRQWPSSRRGAAPTMRAPAVLRSSSASPGKPPTMA